MDEAVDGGECRGKPSPAIFLEAARRLGTAPSDCLVFEDSDEGVEAAHRAGMTVIDVRPLSAGSDGAGKSLCAFRKGDGE